ncbi:hypothetical protein AAEX28_13690 [Lentisphaerota bacterium WC36G]|nr:hypothetical protein LJT99_00445 [Lentisphaerae bacterium WC36]
MGIAALILGIISIVIGLVPLCGFFGIVPAIVGLILGGIDSSKKSKTGEAKGLATAAIILNIIAIIVIILLGSIYLKNAKVEFQEGFEQLSQEIEKQQKLQAAKANNNEDSDDENEDIDSDDEDSDKEGEDIDDEDSDEEDEDIDSDDEDSDEDEDIDDEDSDEDEDTDE